MVKIHLFYTTYNRRLFYDSMWESFFYYKDGFILFTFVDITDILVLILSSYLCYVFHFNASSVFCFTMCIFLSSLICMCVRTCVCIFVGWFENLQSVSNFSSGCLYMDYFSAKGRKSSNVGKESSSQRLSLDTTVLSSNSWYFSLNMKNGSSLTLKPKVQGNHDIDHAAEVLLELVMDSRELPVPQRHAVCPVVFQSLMWLSFPTSQHTSFNSVLHLLSISLHSVWRDIAREAMNWMHWLFLLLVFTHIEIRSQIVAWQLVFANTVVCGWCSDASCVCVFSFKSVDWSW